MFPKLGSGLIFYNDRASLKRCLDSLTVLNPVFCIDGRFPNFSGDGDLSTDGSRELVKSYTNTILVDYPGSEVDKRNKYLELAAKYGLSHLLIIDSDEWILDVDWPRLEKSLEAQQSGNIFCINFVNLGNETVAPRLWRNPGELEYLEAHNIFRRRGSGEITRSTAGGPLIEGITLAGDANLRTKEQEVKTSDYQTWLIAHEKAIKFKYGFRSSPE